MPLRASFGLEKLRTAEQKSLEDALLASCSQMYRFWDGFWDGVSGTCRNWDHVWSVDQPLPSHESKTLKLIGLGSTGQCFWFWAFWLSPGCENVMGRTAEVRVQHQILAVYPSKPVSHGVQACRELDPPSSPQATASWSSCGKCEHVTSVLSETWKGIRNQRGRKREASILTYFDTSSNLKVFQLLSLSFWHFVSDSF